MKIATSSLVAGAFALSLVLSRPASAHDVQPPRLMGEPTAEWPEGHVETHDVVVPLALTISTSGDVESALVEASISPDFDAAALRAARTWKFEPALRDGKPVAAKVRASARFVGRPTAAAPVAPAVAPPSPAPPTMPVVPTAPNDVTPTKAQDVTVRGTAPPRAASDVVRARDVLTAAPHRTASDLLRVVPGVFITQHSGEGKAHQIFLRGFDAVHGQDLELWVAGIPVNEVSNIHGQGYSDLHFVMPEVVREVSATPGTYDPRQGDFAVAGTVRMKLGMNEPGITTKGTLGSFGSRRLFLAYHPKDAPEDTFAAFEEYSTDGFGPNRAARRGSFVGQLTHDLGEGATARVFASTYSGRFDSAGVLRARDIDSGAIDRFATYDPKQGGHSTRTQLLLEVHKDDDNARWSIAPFVVMRALSLRQNFTGHLRASERRDGGADDNDNDNTQQLHDATTAGATASYRRLVAMFSERDAFEAGFYARTDFIEQSQARLSPVDDHPTESLVDAKVRGTNVAGYLDGAVFPIKRLALRGGLRVDALSYATQDRLLRDGATGNAAERSAQGAHLGKKLTADVLLLSAPARNVHALASYGEGFRSPQARSLAAGERTPFTTVRSYEAGLRYGEGQRFASSLALFHTDLSDDLAFDPETARNEAVPSSQRNGLALELTARPRDWLVMSASATYTRATFTGANLDYREGDLLPYVPQLVVRTDTAVRGALARLAGRTLEGRVGYGIEALASRPLPYGQSGQNVFLLDATAGLRLKEVELGLDVYNLLDAGWYDGQFVYASNFSRGQAASLVPEQHVTVGAPRSVFLSLSLHL